MVKIKICGITNLEDALLAADYGADALGFIFYPPSRRGITAEKAGEIIAKLPPFIFRIGVFVDEKPEKIQETVNACRLDGIQLHGSETLEYCRLFRRRVIKSFRPENENSVKEIGDYHVDAFLLDSYHPELMGGTGATFDWELAVAAKMFGPPVILSGGLTPENVAEAIRLVEPYAVDVASGVEAFQGKKDAEKMKNFIEQARWASE
ncbi:MAG: phosphoribosylanthranilate isomerase [Actinomycetota bacterium]|nr:phosphoribosylanthranilate isomerase [Actinomycetota bacterium]